MLAAVSTTHRSSTSTTRPSRAACSLADVQLGPEQPAVRRRDHSETRQKFAISPTPASEATVFNVGQTPLLYPKHRQVLPRQRHRRRRFRACRISTPADTRVTRTSTFARCRPVPRTDVSKEKFDRCSSVSKAPTRLGLQHRRTAYARPRHRQLCAGLALRIEIVARGRWPDAEGSGLHRGRARRRRHRPEHQSVLGQADTGGRRGARRCDDPPGRAEGDSKRDSVDGARVARPVPAAGRAALARSRRRMSARTLRRRPARRSSRRATSSPAAATCSRPMRSDTSMPYSSS